LGKATTATKQKWKFLKQAKDGMLSADQIADMFIQQCRVAMYEAAKTQAEFVKAAL
jgi:hypothetical protein